MRIHTAVPVAFLSVGILASAGCSDQASELTAPETTVAALQAPAEASFQRQNVNTGQATFGNLIAALNNISVNINNLQALNDLIDTGDITLSDINISLVSVDDVLSGNNIVALNNALNRNDVDINVLRNFLNNNDIDISVAIQDVLNNNQLSVSDVIAVSVLSGGDITVFTM